VHPQAMFDLRDHYDSNYSCSFTQKEKWFYDSLWLLA